MTNLFTSNVKKLKCFLLYLVVNKHKAMLQFASKIRGILVNIFGKPELVLANPNSSNIIYNAFESVYMHYPGGRDTIKAELKQHMSDSSSYHRSMNQLATYAKKSTSKRLQFIDSALLAFIIIVEKDLYAQRRGVLLQKYRNRTRLVS
jgi:hypothetical protein